VNDVVGMLGEHPLLALVVIVVLGFVALRVAVRLACLGVVAVAVILVAITLLGGA
jgi:hypothetical protein